MDAISTWADVNECLLGNCDQTCTNHQGHFTCSCLSGYNLDIDGRTCNGKLVMYTKLNIMILSIYDIVIDIDECSSQDNNCTQICTNTIGLYQCGCDVGYMLDADGFTCGGKQ